MIRSLLTGTLHTAPQARISQTGKPFTTGKLKADATDSCSDLQSKIGKPAIIAIFRPELSATERRSNRNYLQLNLQSKIPNLQSKGLNRHYLQLKIWTWTGPENQRLLDAMPVATRSTSGMACRRPEIQSRKQRPASARSDKFMDAVSVANNVGLPATIAGLIRLIAGSVASNVGFGVCQLQIMSVEKHP